MGGFTFGAYGSLGPANQTIATNDSLVFGTIDNASQVATEVSVEVTYGAASKGANIQIERDIDGTNFEGADSSPWTIPMPFGASSTKQRVITIDAAMIGKCRVRVVNTDASVAVTNVNVRIKQATFA